METKPVRVNFKSLSSPDLNRFAMQQVLVETGVDYEYSNQGQWLLGQPTFKPDGKRAIFTDIEKSSSNGPIWFHGYLGELDEEFKAPHERAHFLAIPPAKELFYQSNP